MRDLPLMLKLVQSEYPNVTDTSELAFLITDVFQVLCTEEDLDGYSALFFEDIELESRRHEYYLENGFRIVS